MRHFALLPTFLISFTTLVFAREDSLFTSSVSYCAPPESLLVQQFDLEYIAHNSSVSFNITAASVQKNLNVTANALLNVYGIKPLNLTIDFCSILDGVLCPLPTYNFSGQDSIPLPSSVDVASHIPGIAYRIPDLEAFAQLTLVEPSTGEVKACLQTTLSNGWSTRQTGVAVSTGVVALLVLLIHPRHFLDFMALFQHAALSGLLNLNYSLAYRSFALNFAWAIGLFSKSSSIQHAIDHMRMLTGALVRTSAGDGADALVNRKLSPYNALGLPMRSIARRATEHAPVTVTTTSDNVLQAGIPVYATSLNITPANSFMSVFFTFIIMFALAATLAAFGWVLVALISSRTKGNWWSWSDRVRANYPLYLRATALRLLLVAFQPVLIFSFYQWTIKDSWLSILLSVILFISVCAGVSFAFVRVVSAARKAGSIALYDPVFEATYGPLYESFRPERWHACAPPLAAAVLRAIFVGFAKADGLAQVVALLVLEFLLFAYTILVRPHRARRGNGLGIFLATARLAVTVLLVPFVVTLNVKAIPRVAIGLVIIVIYGLATIVLFFRVVFAVVPIPMRFRRKGSSTSSTKLGTEASNLEKGLDRHTISAMLQSSSLAVSRPHNPSPTRTIPLNEHRESSSSYPPLPTPSSLGAHSQISPAYSDFSARTGSTTLGSVGNVLPRRFDIETWPEEVDDESSTIPRR